MKKQKTRRSASARKKAGATRALTGLRRADPKKAAIKRRIRQQRPLHIRMILHPITVMVILCVGVLIIGWTAHVIGDYYTLTAKVAAPPLPDGAVITSPAEATVLAKTPVDVTGTCPDSSYVKLTRNGTFSGVAWCAADNTYLITTDLYAGQNVLQAQDYNITDDAGPSTPSVTVTYNPPAPPPTKNPGTTSGSSSKTSTPKSTTPTTTTSTSSSPLLLSGDFHYQAYFTGRNYAWTLHVSEGKVPYSVVTSWVTARRPARAYRRLETSPSVTSIRKAATSTYLSTSPTATVSQVSCSLSHR